MAAPAERTDKKDNSPVSDEVAHAITITFKRLHCKSPFGQFKETAPAITKLLHRSCRFELFPEWRHATGDIHYHGIIWIVDTIKWLKQTLPSLKGHGFVLIKKIDNYSKWEEYCIKERGVANGILPDQITLPINKVIEVVRKQKKTIVCMKTSNITECLNIVPESDDIDISDSE